MQKSILIIEDDQSILRGLKHNLAFEGYKVLTANEGKEGMNLALNNRIDMLLLDIMLPGINGYEICRMVKKEKPELPIIMITARGTEIDKVTGLDVGADDYLTKPFGIAELLARIRALFRRTSDTTKVSDTYSFGHVHLDFKKYKVHRNNIEVKLTTKEFAIIKYLIQREGEVVHRHDLLDEVWGFEVTPTTRTVDNYIFELRKKLESNPSKPAYILSIRGIGYKFEPDPDKTVT